MADMTLLVSDEMVKLVPGKLPRATIAYSADGLQVYQLGTSKHQHEDCLRNIVLQECISRHIPAFTLRDRRVQIKPGKPIYSETRDMFGTKK